MATRPAYVWTGSDFDEIGDKRLGPSVTALESELASKLPFAYSDTEPTTTVEGFVWFDENFTPPIAKVWNGTAFVAFSQGPADFSDAADGTYTDDGISYKWKRYNASGTLTVTRAGFADVLVIGGGGGGGRYGGGGGAGGYLYATDIYLPSGTLTVTVGAGGAGGPSLTNRGLPGAGSVLDFLIVPGGGGGGARETNGNLAGEHGGSGGGGGSRVPASALAGAGVAGLGNNGGAGNSDGVTFSSGGGGGGANASGAAGSSGGGGAGGAGLANGITDPTSPITRAGGGGGGTDVGTTAGAGGAGGGGAGSKGITSATSGTANTGGGGGGSGGNAAAGSGGSGIVIVRVKV